jgi:hypothetical protein
MLNFSDFSPKSFERLTQAVCAQVFGAGTVSFGSGPDGGREATFTGEIPFPSSVDRWNGYIVVQAKCCERPRNTIEDADWLIGQLQREFRKYRDAKRRLKLPEFYLVSTNVRLSAAANVGGRDKVEDFLRSACSSLGIKRHHLWSADDLEVLLDTAPDIRRSYSAWLTPSDVLSDLIKSLERPNLSRLLPLALSRDIREERDIRLRDAGQETEKPIFIDRVFVDLPVGNAVEVTTTSSGEFDPIEGTIDDDPVKGEEEDEDKEEDEESGWEGTSARKSIRNVAALLQLRAADKLDPKTCKQQRPRGPLSNRIVLLGGPGQGKSTIGQFLCQLARARMLSMATRHGFLTALQNEIEAEPSPFTRPTELERLGLPYL